jgi:hypothetical protein
MLITCARLRIVGLRLLQVQCMPGSFHLWSNEIVVRCNYSFLNESSTYLGLRPPSPLEIGPCVTLTKLSTCAADRNNGSDWSPQCRPHEAQAQFIY